MAHQSGPLVKRSRHRPLTPVTRVRFPHGSPKAGVYYVEDPPVPIPNTEVKLNSADNTWRVTAWEDRSMPALEYSTADVVLYSHFALIAQSVEHAAVNRRVVGSSPTGGAKSGLPPITTASRSFQIRCYGHGPLAQLVRATGS